MAKYLYATVSRGLIAAFVGASVLVRSYWHKIKSGFKKVFTAPANENEVDQKQSSDQDQPHR